MKTKDYLQPRNRRSADRLRLNLPISCQGTRGRTLNISKTGMRYLVPKTVSPGTPMKLSVQFQNGSVDCQAETVWVKKLGVSSVVGVRFSPDQGSEEIGKHLDEIVSSTHRFFRKPVGP